MKHVENASRLAIIILPIIAFALVIYSTPQGVSTTPDGINYLAAARSLVDGDGYLRFSGEPLLRWPPLYPTILAGLGLISTASGVSLLLVIAIFNVLCHASLVALALHLLQRHLEQRWLIWIGGAAVLCSYPLFLTTFFALSEPLFNLLVLVFLWLFLLLWRRPAWHVLISLGIVAALAALQRYAGIAVLACGTLAILLCLRQVSLWRRFRYAFVFGGVSAAPLLLWMLHNYSLTGNFSNGHLDPVLSVSPQQIFAQIFDVMIQWIVPQAFLDRFQIGYYDVGLFIAVMLCFAGVAWWVRGGTQHRFWARIQRKQSRLLVVNTLFIVLYVVMIFLLNILNTNIAIEDRTLSPLYVPLVLTFCVVFDAIARSDRRLLRHVMALSLALWLIYPIGRFVQQVRVFTSTEYNVAINAPYLDLTERLASESLVYSTHPLINLKYSWQRVRLAPASLDVYAPLLDTNERTYLLWIDTTCETSDKQRGYCQTLQYTPDDLMLGYMTRVLATFDNAVIICISKQDRC